MENARQLNTAIFMRSGMQPSTWNSYQKPAAIQTDRRNSYHTNKLNSQSVILWSCYFSLVICFSIANTYILACCAIRILIPTKACDIRSAVVWFVKQQHYILNWSSGRSSCCSFIKWASDAEKKKTRFQPELVDRCLLLWARSCVSVSLCGLNQILFSGFCP